MANVPDSIFFESITAINARWKAKEFSAVELARAFSDRLERLGPRFNALALSLRESAVRKAKDLDDERKRERFRGPLQAVPFAVKDLLAVEGHPTTWGAKPYAGQVFDYTATAVQKLQKTGGLLMGKLAMVELAGGPSYRYASASLTGPGLNPWDRTRWSGGSSSGSGAAVAAGIVPYALGSETSGSILTPASFCGVTGLRPTYGLVSRYGAMALSWTLDKIGPLARSAEDCAIVLQAISGGDSNDPGSAGKGFFHAPQFARPMKEITIGFAPVDFAEWAEPEARPALQKAFEDIKALGVKVKETRLPEFPYGPMVSTIIGAEAASIFEELITSGKVDTLADARQIAGLKAAIDIPAKDYLKAMRVRSLVQDAFRQLFVDVDVLVTPSRFGVAGKVSDPLDRGGSNRPRPKDLGMSGAIAAGNLAGLPALSLPCGFAGELPVGIQLIGRPFTEGMLIAMGREYQSRTDWHKRRPPVEQG